MRIHQGLVWIAAFVLSLSFLGLVGCGSDDDDSTSTTTVVVTNVVTGVVVTNTPVATLNVAGDWSGVYENQNGSSQVDVQLLQNGDAVTGQFAVGADTGSVSGTLTGDHLITTLSYSNSPKWIKLDGHVNASSTVYQGNWTDSLGNSGTFALQK